MCSSSAERIASCYAGTVGLTKGDDRYVRSYLTDMHLTDVYRLFEFLAAAKANKTTRIPGIESFTSALIYALETLVRQKEGRFTTDELLRTIKDAPNFPKDQEPQLVERRNPHTRAGRIMLHPIRLDRMESQTSNECQVIQRTSDSESLESSISSSVSSEDARDEKSSTLPSSFDREPSFQFTEPRDKSSVDADIQSVVF